MVGVGTFVLVYVALALIVFPILALAFPRQAIVAKGARAVLGHNSAFRTLVDSDETALTIQLLRLPESWLPTRIGLMYLLVSIIFLFLGIGAVVALHVALIVVLAVFFVAVLTLAPMLAVALGRYSLKSAFNQAAVDYRTTVVYSLILVASQIRGTTTTDNAINSLSTLLPSTTVQRFVNDVAVFRTNSGGDATTGKVLSALGDVWGIPSCVLIGDIMDSGLEAPDVADQMLSQVEMAYLNQLSVDHKKYKAREAAMNIGVMIAFSMAAIIALIPALVGLLSKGGF